MRVPEIRGYRTATLQQPEETSLIGYSALINALNLKAAYPNPIAVVSDKRIRADKGKKYSYKDGFAVYENNYKGSDDVGSHLLFALKYEGIDLFKLKKIFEALPERALEEFISEVPSSSQRRQIWFLYEWLLDKKLNLPNTDVGNYVDAIDPAEWQTASPVNSTRHRVRDNLPGTRHFCPLVKKTVSFDAPLAELVDDRVSEVTKNLSQDVLRRLTNRLLIKDSKSTFLIESENPTNVELQRWSEVIKNAGSETLSVELLTKLQKVLMKDRRFVVPGIRKNGVFLGEHVDGYPIPAWIGAKPEDLSELLDGIIKANERMADSCIDPIVQAASVSFGFVFVHPFEDGNGRMHRYLMQHIMNSRGVAPKGIVMPIANSIWEDMNGYSEVFNHFNAPRMPLIEWKATQNGNIEVVNDTKDIYSFFDATETAEFLKNRIKYILDQSIPNEVKLIYRRDKVIEGARDIFDMPTSQLEKLMNIILQNGGTLSKGKRAKMYPDLTDGEVEALEDLIQDAYELDVSDKDDNKPN